MEVLVRFNHDALRDNQRWRLLWDGKEIICNSVRFECSTMTVKKPVFVNNESVTKWHIQPINPSKLIFDYLDNELNVTIL
jgi:hypothetical protein